MVDAINEACLRLLPGTVQELVFTDTIIDDAEGPHSVPIGVIH
jgi:hypothetical protein